MPIDPSAVTRGYADYQRVGSWDSANLWATNLQPITTQVNTPVFDVSRFAYTAGFMSAAAGSIYVRFVYYADAAGTFLLGERDIVLSDAIINYAQLRIPNLGPFMRLQIFGNSPGANTITAAIFGTNRYHPLELIPVAPQIVTIVSTAVAAAGQLIVYPTDYYAGPVSIWTFNTSTTAFLHMQYLDTNGVWQYAWRSGQNGNDQYTKVVVPTGAWRLLYATGANATATLYVSAVASTTGSA